LIHARPKWHELDGYTFKQYIRDFNKEYSSEELEMRRAIFEKKLSLVQAHNANPSFTWKEGVNHLTDYTEEEFGRLRGYNKQLGFSQVAKREASRPIRPEYTNIDVSALPSSIDWRDRGVVSVVKDQGNCGSCWAFASAETLESQYALATGILVESSPQNILDCTDNPNSCGGTGGCEGGTAELAYSNILINGWKGLMSEWRYPYLSHSGKDQPKCLFNVTYVEATLNGFEVLPSNLYDPLINAIATKGPLVISVDASTWDRYESGVFNGCNQTNPDIDHAVQLVGYGTDAKLGDYWLVRNSWTPFWGEKGYIRLYRNNTLSCGIDLNPEDGTGCKNAGPQKVCGTCGIAFDVSFPLVAGNNYTTPY